MIANPIAATAIAPSAPEPRLPSSEALAEPSRDVAALVERHRGLLGAKEFLTSLGRHGGTIVESSCTAATAAALGTANGRFGGQDGVLRTWGIPLDAAVAVAGHVGGFVYSFVADHQADAPLDVARSCHAIGDAGLAIAAYRFFHRRGVESARRAATSSRASR